MIESIGTQAILPATVNGEAESNQISGAPPEEQEFQSQLDLAALEAEEVEVSENSEEDVLETGQLPEKTSKVSQSEDSKVELSEELASVVSKLNQQISEEVKPQHKNNVSNLGEAEVFGKRENLTNEPELLRAADAPKGVDLKAVAKDRGPIQRIPTTSPTAIVSDAGLEPWRMDWVFDQKVEPNRLKPLLGGKPNSPEAAQIDQIAQLRSAMQMASSANRGETVEKDGVMLADSQVSKMVDRMNGSIDNLKIDPRKTLDIPEAHPEMSKEQTPKMTGGSEFIRTLDSLKSKPGEVEGQRNQDNLLTQGRTAPVTLSELDGVLSSDLVERQERLNTLNQSDRIDWTQAPRLGGVSLAEGVTRSVSTPLLKGNVDALVTQGSLASERFSSEALMNISGEIGRLQSGGGGELQIRLRPDNLGELRVRVSTVGDQVALRFVASDQRAKGILEESMNYLKESLGSQNLSLGKFDVLVSGNGNGAGVDLGNGQFGESSQGNYHGGQDYSGASGERESRSDGEAYRQWRRSGGEEPPHHARGEQRSSSNYGSSGRLDVVA